ncbi:MAG: SDR family NAD(P)-dependent oxidoreductase [Candidatus Latescibacteria bacterium]|nr:SDR family NAD(P)-dependent oxidoreductase [Candidatus Latescibacterota bacterium]
MEKILVTGAGGFIGSHLVETLVKADKHVRAFVRYTSRNAPGHLENLDPETASGIELYHGDFEDFAAVARAVEGVDKVFHLGALIAIPYSYAHPVDVVQANVLGTLNVLEACRHAGTGRVVLMSSSEVYGTARYAPIDEEHPLQGQSPYAATKIAADKLGESYHLSYDLPLAIARPFNTYGPRQSARAVIPALIVQGLTRDEVEVGNLHPTRDFCFVRDTVAGLVAIGESDQAIGEVINLGTGSEISIGDLAQEIADILGRPLKLREDAQRLRPAASEVDRLLAANAKAKELLGWSPQWALRQGLEETARWIEAHLDQYQPGRYAV